MVKVPSRQNLHDRSQRGNSRRSCETFGRGDRPAVPQRLCAAAPGRTGNCGILPPPSWSTAAVGGADGPDQSAFRGCTGSFRSKIGAEHRPVPKEGAQRRPCSRTATGGEAACAFRHPLGDLAVPGLGIEAMRPRHATCLRLRRCSILTIFETCSPQRSRASRRSARNSCRWYTAATPEIVPLW
jgi:hypothetical protein